MSAVLLERRDRVLLITLNRPEVLNAVDGAVTRELTAALDRLETDDEVRAAVLTGAGRAFCAGLDLRAAATGDGIDATRDPEHGFAGMTSRMPGKPIVAAVNGDAVGGGFELALVCDVIVAVPAARFALPEVTHGLFAAGGGVFRLPQQLPEKVAIELMLTGRFASAAELAGWGLVHAVVEDDRVVHEATRIATRIAANAPLAVRATRRLAAAARTVQAAGPRAAALVEDEAGLVFPSSDAREGMTAFSEGRLPRFTGT